MILDESYNNESFIHYLNSELMPGIISWDKRDVELDNNSLFKEMKHLGTAFDGKIAIFEAIYDESDSKKRIAITQNAFRILRKHGISNALIAFSSGTSLWRLSLLTSRLQLQNGIVTREFSNPHRYSFLLGKDAKTKTPEKFLYNKGAASSLENLKERFSVEVVNKQFYEKVAIHFTKLVGGSRNGNSYERQLTIYGTDDSTSTKHQEFAVRLIGRIMFCWFLKEKKSKNGIPLVPETMLSTDAVEKDKTKSYYHSVLEPLFFELLNTRKEKRKKHFSDEECSKIPYLNGGLFYPHDDDHYKFSETNGTGKLGVITISNEWFSSFFDVLETYNFTVDENTSYDVELSIDPEMLGRIFEKLLAEINPQTGKSAKKSTGSFYTPREIVDYMVDTSLFQFLKQKTDIGSDKLKALISYGQEDDREQPLIDEDQEKVVEALSRLTILDPACGSGAFPIGILQKIVYILQQVDPEASRWAQKQYSSVTSPELRREIRKKQERGLFDYIRKLCIIRESIFGIDIQGIATEIAKLRCFLSLVVEEEAKDDEPNRGIQPLPNLDFKFITCDSLVRLKDQSESTGQLSMFENQEHIRELKRIRDVYFSAPPDERDELYAEFKEVQKAMFEEAQKNYGESGSNLYTALYQWNPFSHESTPWFDPEWMFGVKEFDILIANPPYINFSKNKEQSQKYGKIGYATYEARGDIYTLFYEKGVSLLRQNGILCFITSSQWMKTGYGEPLRAFFAQKTNPIHLIDFTGQEVFEATVNTNILLLMKAENEKETKALIVQDKESVGDLITLIEENGIPHHFDTGKSWAILSTTEQEIKAKIEALGTPLKEWDIQISYGIKTGYNKAFIIDQSKRDELISKDPNSAEIIHPILRGEDIKRYRYNFSNLYIILAYYNSYNIIQKEYPYIYEHLKKYETELKERGQSRYTSNKKTKLNSDFPGQHHWLELDNNPTKNYIDSFSKPKIIWGNMSLKSSFALSEDNIFVRNPSNIITPGKKYLLALLNSKLCDFYIKSKATMRDNGFYEYLSTVIKDIPVIKVSDANQERLESLVDCILRENNPDNTRQYEDEIDDIVFDLYGLSPDEINFIKNKY
ncbi:MAG: TaqI-like C-terminal specificity domain-containing protein [Paludibacter sp.]|nr:TaqI-like C-terminal specificity domain-containing protein [Paludibacter sp.]MDD4429145.1 TaqI-like C-terminal specificity domain-containing protein [Paludibacter sp.]